MTPERRKYIKARLNQCHTQQERNSYLESLKNNEYVEMIFDQEPPNINCLIPAILIFACIVLFACVLFGVVYLIRK